MAKFKYLYSFKYKGKDYIFLTSKEYPFYFAEYDKNTKKTIVPDIGIFLELHDLYQKDAFLSVKDKLYNIKSILEKRWVEAKPLVRTTSGVLTLSLALSLCGCTQIPLPPKEETSISVSQEDELTNYFLSHGIHIDRKNYNGDEYIFVKDCVGSSGVKQITLSSLEEFRAFKNMEEVPTYEMVYDAFKNNINIPDEEKEVILESLLNMQNSKELEELDLSVLYFNAKRMSIKKIPFDLLKEKVNNESVYAFFETSTGDVYIPSDIPFEKFEFIHEVLGHGTLAYREKIDDNLYIYDGTNQLMFPTEDRYTGYSLGKTFSEGGANIIARCAVKDDNTKTFYQLFEEELRLIAEACHVSIGELLNYRGESFYDLMYQNYVNYPVKYMIESDLVFNGIVNTEFSTLLETLLLDATYEDYVASDEAKKEDIISSTMDIIRNSNFKEGLEFSYPDGTIYYDPEKSALNYKEKMEKVK